MIQSLHEPTPSNRRIQLDAKVSASSSPMKLRLDELKEFALVSSKIQRIGVRQMRRTLARIESPSGSGAGSWSTEWSQEARVCALKGDFLGAARRFYLARFPYVDCNSRLDALVEARNAMVRWGCSTPEFIREIDLVTDTGRNPCYLSGEVGSSKPLLVLMGGIVSTKEQWIGMLSLSTKLNLTVAALDFPGTGYSSDWYTPNSSQRVAAQLRALIEHTAAPYAVAVASSFSGPLFINAAAQERRLKGLIVHGAPIGQFFTDPAWWARVPSTTKFALATACNKSVGDIQQTLKDFAVSHQQMSNLEIPITYIQSTDDNIIPPGESDYVKNSLPNSTIWRVKDVHGTPNKIQLVGAHIVERVLQYTNQSDTPIGRSVSRWCRTARAVERIRFGRESVSGLGS